MRENIDSLSEYFGAYVLDFSLINKRYSGMLLRSGGIIPFLADGAAVHAFSAKDLNEADKVAKLDDLNRCLETSYLDLFVHVCGEELFRNFINAFPGKPGELK